MSAADPAGVLANVERAMHVASRLRDAGLAVILPHLCVEWNRKYPADYEVWLAMDLALVGVAHALLRIAPSPGTDREVAHALACGVPVFTDVDELLREAAA